MLHCLLFYEYAHTEKFLDCEECMKRILVLIMCAFAQTILGSQAPSATRARVPRSRVSGTITPTTTFAPVAPTVRQPLIGREQEKVPKLTIDLIPSTENIDKDIQKLQQLTLYTSGEVKFLGSTLEKQTNATYWVALAYLQQVGSAYQWQNSLDEQEFQQEIDRLEDIISFNDANTQIARMSLGKQELYLSGLIKAMDYILNPAAQDWRDFLNNTTEIQIRKPLPFGGIRFSDSLASALNDIKDEYSKLQASRNALEKDLQEIISKKPVPQRPTTTAVPTTTTTQPAQGSVPLTPQTGALVPYIDVTQPRPTPRGRPTVGAPGTLEEYEEARPTRIGIRPPAPAAQPYAVSVTSVMPINILPLAANKTQVPGKLEQLRELRLDSGNISMSIEDLQNKDDANYWLALAFLQRVASAYAQWRSNKLSEQEKKEFKDIADFGYWFSITEEFDDAWLWQAIIDAIFYIQHPNNQGWNAFLVSNNIKLAEGLTQNLRNIRAKFDDTLNKYKTYAAILASAAQNNVYSFAEQFLQAMLILKIEDTAGKKASYEELEKARTIFVSLLQEMDKNKALEAELTKAKRGLRSANIGFDRYLDRKDIKEDLQSNKILLDRLLRAKERIPEQKRLAERAERTGIIPVPVPVPIKEKRAQEQAVAGIEKPQPQQPAQPAIEQPVQPIPEPVAIVQPQPEPIAVAPAVAPMPEAEAPIVPGPVPPAELPAPSLEISPIEGEQAQTKTLSGQELVQRWQAYNKEMRAMKTPAQMQEFIERLENEKQLIEAQPGILERAKDQLKDLQEQENEMRRLQGMQLVPYTGKPEITPEGKQPQYTLAPGVKEMLAGKTEEAQPLPEWQQRMMEERLTQRLNEQLSQQLLEQEQMAEPVTPEPVVTILPSAPPVTVPPSLPIYPPSVAPAPVEQKPIFARAQDVAPAFKKPSVKRPQPTPAPAEVEIGEQPVQPAPVTPPSAFAAAAALGKPQPSPVAVQTAMAVAPAPVIIPAERAEVLSEQPQIVSPKVTTVPVKPAVSENVITQLEQVIKDLKEMALPAIREKSKDKDIQELAKVFLQQALQAYELYTKYQPLMKRQQVLIELRDWSIFFNQLEQAYIRARESHDSTIAAAYFEALQIAIDGKVSSWMLFSTPILTKEQEPLFKKLKQQFAKNIAETEVLLRIAQGAAQQGPLVLKSVWEFITSLIVVVKDDENYPQERKAAADALLRLLPLVDPESPSYNEDIENELHTARKALLAGFKSSQSDTYPFYLSIIHTSGDESRVYDDIHRALNKLNIPPPTRIEQEKRELTQLIKNQDPRAITKLQEIEQLPADVKKEMRVALEHIQPAYQEKLANIYTDVIGKEAQAGNIAQAQALVKQAGNILPAQQANIIAKTQPTIAKAVQDKAKVEMQAKPIEQLKPQEAQIEVAPLVPPARKPNPITPEEKEFLKQKLPLTDQIIFKVLEIFERATKLNDEASIRAASFAMKGLMDQLNKLKTIELIKLDAVLVEKLRALWESQVQAMVVAYIAKGEQGLAIIQRAKRLNELEMIMDEAPTTEQLHDMIPELKMMIDLGQKNLPAQAVGRQAQALYDRVERRLQAFTRWIEPAK